MYVYEFRLSKCIGRSVTRESDVMSHNAILFFSYLLLIVTVFTKFVSLSCFELCFTKLKANRFLKYRKIKFSIVNFNISLSAYIWFLN